MLSVEGYPIIDCKKKKKYLHHRYVTYADVHVGIASEGLGLKAAFRCSDQGLLD